MISEKEQLIADLQQRKEKFFGSEMADYMRKTVEDNPVTAEDKIAIRETLAKLEIPLCVEIDQQRGIY